MHWNLFSQKIEIPLIRQLLLRQTTGFLLTEILQNSAKTVGSICSKMVSGVWERNINVNLWLWYVIFWFRDELDSWIFRVLKLPHAWGNLSIANLLWCHAVARDFWGILVKQWLAPWKDEPSALLTALSFVFYQMIVFCGHIGKKYTQITPSYPTRRKSTILSQSMS